MINVGAEGNAVEFGIFLFFFSPRTKAAPKSVLLRILLLSHSLNLPKCVHLFFSQNRLERPFLCPNLR
jgi:hypothetical protein